MTVKLFRCRWRIKQTLPYLVCCFVVYEKLLCDGCNGAWSNSCVVEEQSLDDFAISAEVLIVAPTWKLCLDFHTSINQFHGIPNVIYQIIVFRVRSFDASWFINIKCMLYIPTRFLFKYVLTVKKKPQTKKFAAGR